MYAKSIKFNDRHALKCCLSEKKATQCVNGEKDYSLIINKSGVK